MYIDDQPTATGNATITNPWSLYVNRGNTFLGGTLSIDTISNNSRPSWLTTGICVNILGQTFNNSSTAASNTAVSATFTAFGQPTLTATNTSVTTTRASTVYIDGAPIAGTNQTITNRNSLWVGSGNVLIGETGNSSSSTTGALVITGGVGIGGNAYIGGNVSYTNSLLVEQLPSAFLPNIIRYPSTITNSVTFCSITYSATNNIYIASIANTASNNPYVYTSTDYTNWTAATCASLNASYSIVTSTITWSDILAQGVLCISISDGTSEFTYTYRSTNVSNWNTTQVSVLSGSASYYSSMIYVPSVSRYVASGGGALAGKILYASTSVTSWTVAQSTSTGSATNSIFFNQSLGMIFVTLFQLSGTYAYFTSTDGINWTGRAFIGSFVITSIRSNTSSNVIVATSASASTNIYRSTDEINWTTYTNVLSMGAGATGVLSYISSYSIFICVPNSLSNIISYSSDGITWSNITLNHTITSTSVYPATFISETNLFIIFRSPLIYYTINFTNMSSNNLYGGYYRNLASVGHQWYSKSLSVSSIGTNTMSLNPVSLNLLQNTTSTSTTTGSLVVTGGVGIGGNAYIGGNLVASGTLGTSGIVTLSNATTSTSITTGALVVTGGVGIGGNAYIGGTLRVSGIVTLPGATTSTSSATGALVVSGGVGIGGTVNAGALQLPYNAAGSVGALRFFNNFNSVSTNNWEIGTRYSGGPVGGSPNNSLFIYNGLVTSGGASQCALVINTSNQIGINGTNPGYPLDFGSNTANFMINLNGGLNAIGFSSSTVNFGTSGSYNWYYNTVAGTLGTSIMTLSSGGNLVVNGTGSYTMKTTNLNLGTTTDNSRFIACLNSAHATNTTSYITLGQAASSNNQAEFSFNYIGSGSTSNSLGLGLYGGAYLSVFADKHVEIPSNYLRIGPAISAGSSPAFTNIPLLVTGAYSAAPSNYIPSYANYPFGSTGYYLNNGSTISTVSTTGTYYFSGLFLADVASNAFISYSDVRIKTNINTIRPDTAIDFINKCTPVLYNLKSNLDSIEFGYIAQDLFKNGFPNLVQLVPDDSLEEHIDEDGFVSPAGQKMTISYTKIIPLLAVTIKDLYNENSTQKNTIDTLIIENNELKTKVNDLESRLARLEELFNNL